MNRVIIIAGMKNAIVLDDIWIVYLDGFCWEPLKIINNYTDPLFGHNAFLIP
jgi:hypothetical protein